MGALLAPASFRRVTSSWNLGVILHQRHQSVLFPEPDRDGGHGILGFDAQDDVAVNSGHVADSPSLIDRKAYPQAALVRELEPVDESREFHGPGREQGRVSA